jgi:hypothetical protein
LAWAARKKGNTAYLQVTTELATRNCHDLRGLDTWQNQLSWVCVSLVILL